MINDKTSTHESNLRKEFEKALEKNKENLVDELISIVKKNYILLSKEEQHCYDCFNFQDNTGTIFITNTPYYCKYYQKPIDHLHMDATDCSHYLNGGLEAKKSIVKFRHDLNNEDWIYE